MSDSCEEEGGGYRHPGGLAGRGRFFILDQSNPRDALIMLKPLFVWEDRALKRILPEQIICLTTEKNYMRIFLTDQSVIMVRSTLASAMKKLPKELFVKIHRSHVVSVLHIDMIYKDHVLLLVQPVPVSRQYYPRLLKRVSVIG